MATQMYEKFQLLDGDHPWRDVAPDGYVDYKARTRDGGRVVYFNYDLARQLGLIPANHARRMVKSLEKAILDTFAIQIINEYDIASGQKFAGVRPKPYMATRYLQAQHRDKRGLYSGDGRAIWNGQVTAGKVTYDVSSRGTGATCLSPGAQVAGQPVKTGDATWGYCCGTAELDEMIGTALMSEIFHQSGLPTERTLTVIDFGDGTAIGVRVAPNLIRPAHIFRYLKQGRHAELKAAFDFFLQRQDENGEWKLPSSEADRYAKALEYIARSYGKLAAVMEEEYIFNWLAWDGDNMLASGAILDYGSIRQFGAKHDRYRYDDIDRFSSCLTEQRFWARELVKVFAQVAWFARTGSKLNLSRFQDAGCLKEFDRAYRREKDRRLLWRLGFAPVQFNGLLRNARREIRGLRRALSFFENKKVARGVEKLPDGVTHAPVFIVRDLLRKLPEFYAEGGTSMDPQEFCATMAASYASRRDLRMTAGRARHTAEFQRCYQKLIAMAGPYAKVLRQVRERSQTINRPDRMTGDSMIFIVEETVKAKESLSREELQAAMTAFIESQVLVPGRCQPICEEQLEANTPKSQLLRAMLSTLSEYRERV